MINVVWLFLLLTGLVVAAFTGRIEAVTNAIFIGCEDAVKVAMGLIAIMAFWLGLSKVADDAGMVRFIARLSSPLLKKLFPGIPQGHPAMTMIMMNLSANFMGLGNTATPLGMAAMKELQKLNPDKKAASNDMCTFLALNTACITIIPSTVIGLRSHIGSANPTEIIGPTFFATACGMLVAVILDRIFRRTANRW